MSWAALLAWAAMLILAGCVQQASEPGRPLTLRVDVQPGIWEWVQYHNLGPEGIDVGYRVAASMGLDAQDPQVACAMVFAPYTPSSLAWGPSGDRLARGMAFSTRAEGVGADLGVRPYTYTSHGGAALGVQDTIPVVDLVATHTALGESVRSELYLQAAEPASFVQVRSGAAYCDDRFATFDATRMVAATHFIDATDVVWRRTIDDDALVRIGGSNLEHDGMVRWTGGSLAIPAFGDEADHWGMCITDPKTLEVSFGRVRGGGVPWAFGMQVLDIPAGEDCRPEWRDPSKPAW